MHAYIMLYEAITIWMTIFQSPSIFALLLCGCPIPLWQINNFEQIFDSTYEYGAVVFEVAIYILKTHSTNRNNFNFPPHLHENIRQMKFW